MSWDSYIDNLILQTKDESGSAHIDKGCIIGKAGNLYTSTEHQFAIIISAQEAKKIGDCFTAGDFSEFQKNGVYIEDVKYQFIREEDKKLVLAKKKDQGAITMQCSRTAIVIGHTKEGCQQGISNKGVGVIADYLESVNM